MIKKRISIILCAIVLCIVMVQASWAANNVSEIEVEVVLNNDGSAYITQTWTANFTEGTEAYIPIENLEDMAISEFLVSDIEGPYTFIENWDVNDGFDQKARRYGIVRTQKGFELCWGISEYGDNRYAIEYKIDSFVTGYTDYDGFNFQFINPGMGTLPTDVTVHILMANGINLTKNNAGIWAFGFNGEMKFENGQGLVYSHRPLSSQKDSVIVMLQLDKGMITPKKNANVSFDEGLKNEAFIGSDYNNTPQAGGSAAADPDEEEGTIFEVIFGLLIMAIPVVVLGYFLFRPGKSGKKLASLYEEADYAREAPLSGEIEATFVLASDFDQINDDEDLIGAAFLQLINAGCLEPITEKEVGFFGKEKEMISLQLIKPPQMSGITTKRLYDLLVLASGEDQVLQELELEKYCKKNYKAYLKIIELAKEEGKKSLEQQKIYDSSKEAKPLGLSQNGESQLVQIMGFKKYLLEFSLIGERSIAESVIWQDYLVFATLLGIADKAIEQFDKVYPDATESSQRAHSYYYISRSYTNSSYYAAQSARSGGSGGKSSVGGGGGFSGGARGGGTR